MHTVADALAVRVFAHALAEAAAGQWDLQPLVVLPLVLSALLYAFGLAEVWRRAGAGRGISWWAAISFATG